MCVFLFGTFVFHFVYSVFLYCFVYCFSFCIYDSLFPVFAQVYGPLQPVRNPTAENKYHYQNLAHGVRKYTLTLKTSTLQKTFLAHTAWSMQLG